MKEYRKTYWPFIVWMLALIPVMLAAANQAEKAQLGDRGMVAVMMAVVVLMLLMLFWMIWLDGYVYWINGGPSYEEAKAAGGEVRREYAWRHLKAMLKGGASALILLAVEYMFGGHELLMVFSTALCVVLSAISTIRIRWPEGEINGPKN